MYDIIEGPNNSTVLDILVPGLSKEDLQCTVEYGVLTVKANDFTNKVKYLKKGIKEFSEIRFYISESTKIDLVTCDNGILRILMSSKLNNETKLEIL